MKLDDETLLTAYLDGELDPHELERVEAALRSDPGLVQRLGELARVRDLVAGLPRPQAPFDLSNAVIGRLAAAQARPWSRRASYWEVALSAAAVVLAAGFIGYLALLRDMHAPARPRGGAPVVARARVATPPVAPAAPQAPAVPPRIHVAAAPRSTPPEPDARLADDQQARFQAMIDSPNLNRIFFVVDAVGGDADRRVGGLVDSLPRADSVYACMTIVPNVGVDPKHPGGAKVFAVALTEPELKQVRNRLHEAFPNAVEEAVPDPSVVTQLAEVSQVSLRPGTAVADLAGPEDTAARIAIKRAHETDENQDEDRGDVNPGPTPEQMRSAPAPYVDARQPRSRPPVADAKRRAAAGPRRRDRDRHQATSVVLIWVASR